MASLPTAKPNEVAQTAFGKVAMICEPLFFLKAVSMYLVLTFPSVANLSGCVEKGEEPGAVMVALRRRVVPNLSQRSATCMPSSLAVSRRQRVTAKRQTFTPTAVEPLGAADGILAMRASVLQSAPEYSLMQAPQAVFPYGRRGLVSRRASCLGLVSGGLGGGWRRLP